MFLRETQRERNQSTSSFSNIPSQSVARRLSRREGPRRRRRVLPRKRRRRAVARWWYLVLGRRASSSTSSSQVDLCDKLKSTFAIGFSKFFTFTDFPPNVCVVTMLCIFRLCTFFSPHRQHHPKTREAKPPDSSDAVSPCYARRVLRKQRDDDHDDEEEEEEEGIPTEREKREEGKKNVTRFVVRRERKKRVKAFFSCEVKKRKKKRTQRRRRFENVLKIPTLLNPNPKKKKKTLPLQNISRFDTLKILGTHRRVLFFSSLSFCVASFFLLRLFSFFFSVFRLFVFKKSHRTNEREDDDDDDDDDVNDDDEDLEKRSSSSSFASLSLCVCCALVCVTEEREEREREMFDSTKNHRMIKAIFLLSVTTHRRRRRQKSSKSSSSL